MFAKVLDRIKDQISGYFLNSQALLIISWNWDPGFLPKILKIVVCNILVCKIPLLARCTRPKG